MVCGVLGRLVRKRLGTDSELLSYFYLLVTTVDVRELNRVKFFSRLPFHWWILLFAAYLLPPRGMRSVMCWFLHILTESSQSNNPFWNVKLPWHNAGTLKRNKATNGTSSIAPTPAQKKSSSQFNLPIIKKKKQPISRTRPLTELDKRRSVEWEAAASNPTRHSGL